MRLFQCTYNEVCLSISIYLYLDLFSFLSLAVCLSVARLLRRIHRLNSVWMDVDPTILALAGLPCRVYLHQPASEFLCRVICVERGFQSRLMYYVSGSELNPREEKHSFILGRALPGPILALHRGSFADVIVYILLHWHTNLNREGIMLNTN